jgi:hypothetical protein
MDSLERLRLFWSWIRAPGHRKNVNLSNQNSALNEKFLPGINIKHHGAIASPTRPVGTLAATRSSAATSDPACPYDRTVPKAAPGITPSSPGTCLSARRLMHLLPVSINWQSAICFTKLG